MRSGCDLFPSEASELNSVRLDEQSAADRPLSGSVERLG